MGIVTGITFKPDPTVAQMKLFAAVQGGAPLVELHKYEEKADFVSVD